MFWSQFSKKRIFKIIRREILWTLESHCVPLLTYVIKVTHVSNRGERRQLRVAYNSLTVSYSITDGQRGSRHCRLFLSIRHWNNWSTRGATAFINASVRLIHHYFHVSFWHKSTSSVSPISDNGLWNFLWYDFCYLICVQITIALLFRATLLVWH